MGLDPFFSVVTVTLNAGRDLEETTKTVDEQVGATFEHIVKDAGSKDGSVASLPPAGHRLVFVEPDRGIYDAMNQALRHCRGGYVVFMNAGDGFARADTLQLVAETAKGNHSPEILYTNYHNLRLKFDVCYPPQLTRRFLFRRVPCHQSLYVRRDMLEAIGGFETAFTILADSQSVMEIMLKRGGRAVHVPVVGNYYKDGGVHMKPGQFNERERQRRILRQRYFFAGERIKWGLLYGATLPVTRTWLLARFPTSPLLPLYQRVVRLVNRTRLFRR